MDKIAHVAMMERRKSNRKGGPFEAHFFAGNNTAMFKKFNQAALALYIKFIKRASLVGKDVFGNTYYEAGGMEGQERFVLYAGPMDASTVPADWHGWLHHTTSRCPGNLVNDPDNGRAMDQREFPKWPWQRHPLPNLTGTLFAYFPAPPGGRNSLGSYLSSPSPQGGGYVPWRPEEGPTLKKNTTNKTSKTRDSLP